MLSYVKTAYNRTASNGCQMTGNDGIGQVSSPPRNLTLHLSTSHNKGAGSVSGGGDHLELNKHAKEVDCLLANGADSCDERTLLLNEGANTNPSLRIQRQSSCSSTSDNNNSSCKHDNDTNEKRIVSDGPHDAFNIAESTDNETFSNDSVTANEIPENTLEFNVGNVHSLHQNSNPRQTMTTITTKKQKLNKLGSNKPIGLKRVSFGSSKGSMVETLVFETPTPLSEHVELNFGFASETDYKANLDDSGIEIQEESERSIVRVSIYQSNQPQQICHPEYFTKFDDILDNSLSNYNCNLENIMTTAASPIPGYDRQQSTESGWDNPFRPGGDLSREADEIVKMISGGKPITPTEDHVIGNGKSQTNGTAANGTLVTEDIQKSNVSQNMTAQNGTNGTHRLSATTATTGGGGGGGAGAAKQTETKAVTSSVQVSKQVVPGPTSASHVVIDEKKNKKKGCCVLQ